jgi:hypothetical protein
MKGRNLEESKALRSLSTMIQGWKMPRKAYTG